EPRRVVHRRSPPGEAHAPRRAREGDAGRRFVPKRASPARARARARARIPATTRACWPLDEINRYAASIEHEHEHEHEHELGNWGRELATHFAGYRALLAGAATVRVVAAALALVRTIRARAAPAHAPRLRRAVAARVGGPGGAIALVVAAAP